MNYELAKELKDAGFPQDKAKMAYSRMIKREGWHLDTRGMIEQNQNHFCGEMLPAPDFSELIEACGGGFYNLYRVDDDEWYAQTFDTKQKVAITSNPMLSPTPEEAVARLWLALNKKAAPLKRPQVGR